MDKKELKALYAGLKAKNWKQENTLTFINEEIMQREDYSISLEHKLSWKIMDLLKRVINVKESFSPKYYYLQTPLFLGKIHGYHNVHLTSISYVEENPYWDRPAHVTFHLTFETENLTHEIAADIKKQQDAFERLTDEEFLAREDEYTALLRLHSRFSPFIPASDYCYGYELPKGKLEEIIAIMETSEARHHAERVVFLANKVRKRQQDVRDRKETYAELLDYWDIYDEYQDLTYYKKPDAAELKRRADRRLKSEQQYKIECEGTAAMIADLDSLKERRDEDKVEKFFKEAVAKYGEVLKRLAD